MTLGDSEPLQPESGIDLGALGIDSDLWSGSCMGMGVRFPHVWEVVRRYILRGDEFYQLGGLNTLATVPWNLPLNDAVDTLQAYVEKHDFAPGQGGRGGVSVAALKAVHAVATVPDEPLADDRRRCSRVPWREGTHPTSEWTDYRVLVSIDYPADGPC